MYYGKIYINGKWIDSLTSDFIDVENPANKEIIGRVPACNEDDVNAGVKAAKEAFKSWQITSLDERIHYLENILIGLDNAKDEMAKIISLELGSTEKFAKHAHVMPYLEEIRNTISLARNYKFETLHEDYIVRREAIGVIGALTPWNYPLGQILKKLAPALLAGNTIVLKPSQNTPLSAYKLAEIIDKSDLPKGVFNLIPGRGSEVGNVLASHKDIDMVSFTGSTEGGIEVSKLALESVKKIALELGGKSPSIILKGADYKLALNKTLNSIYRNTGQSCSALSRLLVPRDDKEEIEKMIVEMTRSFSFGNPKDSNVEIGPLASKKQFDKVKSYIEVGIKEGAKLLIGEVPIESEGYYVGPTVFTDVTNNMEIAQSEIFGPVLCVIAYDSVDEAIDIANDTEYGLSSAVFGEDLEAMEVAGKIKAGGVMVNSGSSLHKAPFGGYKQSGIGREGGTFGLEEFLEIKAIFI